MSTLWPAYLGARARRALETKGIAPGEAEKLRSIGVIDFLRLPGCGRLTITEIERWCLESLGELPGTWAKTTHYRCHSTVRQWRIQNGYLRPRP